LSWQSGTASAPMNATSGGTECSTRVVRARHLPRPSAVPHGHDQLDECHPPRGGRAAKFHTVRPSAEQSHRFALTGKDVDSRNRTIIVWQETDLIEGKVQRQVAVTWTPRSTPRQP
jgi:hypothetical protein